GARRGRRSPSGTRRRRPGGARAPRPRRPPPRGASPPRGGRARCGTPGRLPGRACGPRRRRRLAGSASAPARGARASAPCRRAPLRGEARLLGRGALLLLVLERGHGPREVLVLALELRALPLDLDVLPEEPERGGERGEDGDGHAREDGRMAPDEAERLLAR